MQDNTINAQNPEDNGWEDEELVEGVVDESEIIDQEDHPVVSQPDPSLLPPEPDELPGVEEIDDTEKIEDVDIQEVVDQESLPEPEEIPQETQGRLNLALRQGIRWVFGILILLGLGFLAGIYLLYRPAVEKGEITATQLSAELAAANDKISELENKVSTLNTEIASLQPLKERNDALLVENQELNLHIAILDARVDVANAQLALESNDNAQARITLNQTSLALNTIEVLLEVDQKEVADDLQQRLSLVMDELEDDPFAANSDLDVLETKLLQLEDSLFGQ